jgi:hypothetical protein
LSSFESIKSVFSVRANLQSRNGFVKGFLVMHIQVGSKGFVELYVLGLVQPNDTFSRGVVDAHLLRNLQYLINNQLKKLLSYLPL